ncbi:hypothetical protein G5C51_11980 [Streptomyces sp. A7024]|uniref:Cytochrome C oxidase subunit I n=1 Tax=Streptomyces coryli TaxID=1128680 RepID=A0A6G4U006_9ACTN|nr:hypothetical protein [Streptomyces coryli]NGN64617.1 hypothetical protein [Streptomyces coryli]
MDDRTAAHAGPAAETDRGLRQLDGYLYWQGELSDARREAEELCDRLEWLTTSERDELLRAYTSTRAALTEQLLRRLAKRRDELRADYEARYRQLRSRVVGWAAVAVPCVCLVVEVLRLAV